MQSQTLWMLMAEFDARTAVPLAECLHYLNYETIDQANRAAIEQKLPMPTFRARDTKRAPRMVLLSDIATHIDAAHEKAAASWRAANGIAEPKAKTAAPAARSRRAA